MSNKKNQVNAMPEEEIHEEVVEVQTDVEPAEAVEVVEEQRKENKVLKVLKKAAPFAIIGGALAAAFAFGRHSGSDTAYLAMLSDSSDADEGEDESDGYEDADEGEEETEDAQDE